MIDLLLPLFVGLTGSLHCIGMCGPLVVAYSLHLRPASSEGAADITSPSSQGLIHHLAYQSGRIITYGALGALACALAGLTGLSEAFSALRSVVTLAGGVLMVLFGLAILKVIPLPRSLPALPGSGSFFGLIVPSLFSSKRLGSKFLLGVATGFLPCMLSWAMIVKAASMPSPAHGFLTMMLFGVGTAPVLFFAGFSASVLSLTARLAGERVAACSVIVMGLILLEKGARYFV